MHLQPQLTALIDERDRLKQLKETDKETYVAEPASQKVVFIGYSDIAGQFSARYQRTPIYQTQYRAESYGTRYKPEYDLKINEINLKINELQQEISLESSLNQKIPNDPDILPGKINQEKQNLVPLLIAAGIIALIAS